ncbi:hypothetical protein GCM10023191_030060 [Actinoallomurus oryzae]|uniref:Uncharacterized protein n=1 Tax=Actinoallomurus oryzae TaxID=502180 RepID=A0ABP8PV28_9ACTN
MSQPPGESPADESPSSGFTGGEPTSGRTNEPGDGPADATRTDRPREAASSEQAGPRPSAPAGVPQGQGAAPWWAQQRPPAPPPSGMPGQPPPPPYHPQQPQQPPWAYGPQAPPARPGGPVAPDASAGRDRLLPHLVWEGVLLVVTAVLMIGVAAGASGHGVESALSQAGYLGLLAAGLAFSLRTGSPNLAAGTITAFSGTLAAYLATGHGWGKFAALLVAVLLAAFIGLLLGALAVLLSVPSWALTLGAAAVLQAIMLKITHGMLIPIRFGSYSTAMWYGIFFVVSVGGGALWLVPGVRGALGGARRTGDPARWTDPRGGLGVLAGLTGSSFLAGLAAVPLLMFFRQAEPDTVTLTTLPLAAVLLGGVSVFGRRAGVFGTLFAVTILALIHWIIAYNGGSSWIGTLVVGLAAVVGLGVSRGIESITDTLNRARPATAAPPPPLPSPYVPPPPPPLR